MQHQDCAAQNRRIESVRGGVFAKCIRVGVRAKCVRVRSFVRTSSTFQEEPHPLQTRRPSSFRSNRSSRILMCTTLSISVSPSLSCTRVRRDATYPRVQRVDVQEHSVTTSAWWGTNIIEACQNTRADAPRVQPSNIDRRRNRISSGSSNDSSSSSLHTTPAQCNGNRNLTRVRPGSWCEESHQAKTQFGWRPTTVQELSSFAHLETVSLQLCIVLLPAQGQCPAHKKWVSHVLVI